ncbi:acylphosphatase [Legionella fairfieldensis]|uniref:acylphosphatase n=1 Tax=Legionella fairfieldensis TaxID=45064 RepID=UPI000491B3CF|nr:acylphosphatase [Legionella fairfieldensis]
MTQYVCMRNFITGKVQGVWFRASTQEQAKKLGIKGWVRNLTDGRVEVFACGEKQSLEIFHHWLKEGPPLAKVSKCSREDLPWQDYDSFDILK